MELFVPYVYVPSADASYVKIVTPLGALHVEKQTAWRAVVTLSVLLVTVALYKLCFGGRKAKSSKKSKQSAGAASGGAREESESSGEDENAGEDDGRSALDESLVKKGEHSYYYAHQRRVATTGESDDALKKTMVSTYGWVDGKQTVR